MSNCINSKNEFIDIVYIKPGFCIRMARRARIWLRAMGFVAPRHITMLICRRRAEASIIEPSAHPASPPNAKSGLN
jgi:hypothetical protein